MPLVKKSEGKGVSVSIPGWRSTRLDAFAKRGRYTVKSVVATAIEEWLDEKEDADGIEDREPSAPTKVAFTAAQEQMRKAGAR